MTPVGTSECDSKDMLSYARSLSICKKSGNILKTLKTLRIIHDICERGIKELECGGKKAEDYFMEIF